MLEIQDNPRFKKRFSIKVPSFPRPKRIGCLTLCPKREEVEIHLVIRLLFPSVVRCIEMNAWWEWEIALVGEKRAIRLGIVLN